MRKLIKKITHPFLKKGLAWYYSKPRRYRYEGIEVLVHPDVFPPHLTLSTKILLDFIRPMRLAGTKFLELGCGSGIISLFAAKKGAMVTATDINKTALEYLEKGAKKYKLPVEIIFSNLFENLKNHSFNTIIINPPYYPRKAKSIKEEAWFCGTEFDYFKELFKQLPSYLDDCNIFMILSEDCNMMKIKTIAQSNDIQLQTVLEKKMKGEKNFIFHLSKE